MMTKRNGGGRGPRSSVADLDSSTGPFLKLDSTSGFREGHEDREIVDLIDRVFVVAPMTNDYES